MQAAALLSTVLAVVTESPFPLLGEPQLWRFLFHRADCMVNPVLLSFVIPPWNNVFRLAWSHVVVFIVFNAIAVLPFISTSLFCIGFQRDRTSVPPPITQSRKRADLLPLEGPPGHLHAVKHSSYLRI
ncbi:uncharacterized protein PG986_006587 [Apiospora aurea]|uniref:Uncharacterized protein n=1 Tax=Apiospora aurea TaxID=335848 RepID=A0ABR1QKV2_9PEZI